MKRSRGPLDIAVIGMACRFPGANDLHAFWSNILAGTDQIRDVPADRWNAQLFFDPSSSSPGRVSGCRGGYLDSPVPFDAASFGIMPRTVDGGEPEQFLTLDTARLALEDAGLDKGVPAGQRVEVVVGRGNYFNRGNLTRLQHGRIIEQTVAILQSLHPEWTAAELDLIRDDLRSKLPPFEAATIPGQLTNGTAGRVADRFNFQGASYVVDAASASALVTLKLASRALATHEADLVVAGSVYIQPDVDFPMVFSRLGGLSRTGRSRPFAADADGMVPGEGVGVVILKRLSDAERDGDRVYAVIKGIGIASDGRGPGLAAPSARGHLLAMDRAYRSAGIDPQTVRLVEGHGLGLPAADRAELKALHVLFRKSPATTRRYLGAVSGQIGHAMAAAGMASLIKAALSLHHRLIPMSAGADAPRKSLARPDRTLSLNPTTRPWINGRPAPRRAAVNSFGFAGINGHAVLEEHTPSADGITPGAMPAWPSEAILLGADDRQGLRIRITQLLDQLPRCSHIGLKDIAFNLARETVGRNHPARVGIVAASVDEAIARLAQVARKLDDPACTSIRDGRGIYYWDEPLGKTGRLAFLFPGEGSQYKGMLADLCPHFPEIRAQFDTSDRLAEMNQSGEVPSDLIFGSEAEADLASSGSATVVNLVLSSQWALYQLLIRLGIKPAGIAGHSSGEFLALAAADVVPVDRDFETRCGELGALFGDMKQDPSTLSLVGVATSRERLEAMINDLPAAIVVAVDNCPHQVIVAVDSERLEPLIARFASQGIHAERLPIAHAYHTSAFEPLLGPVRAFFDALHLRAPRIPLYSCCSAACMPGEVDQLRELAIRQWTRPVEFRRTIERMHADGYRVFVDVGARGNLAGFAEDTLRGQASYAVAANLPRRSGLTQINHLVASLFAHGVELNTDFLFARRTPKAFDIASPPTPHKASHAVALGFPEMSLSEPLIERLRQAPAPGLRIDPEGPTGDPMQTFFSSMEAFLQTQRNAVSSFFEPGSRDGSVEPWNQPGEGMNGYGMGTALATRSNGNGTALVSTAAERPWAGVVERLVDGEEVEAFLLLDSTGDPVAENHTFGGRRISAVDPTAKGLPVLPFTVMAEMLAQVAARLRPAQKIVGLSDIRARRWIRYEDKPITLRVVARSHPTDPDALSAALFNMAHDPENPAVEAVILFDAERGEPEESRLGDLADAEPSRTTARAMYEEQWLFHGPRLQAVVEVSAMSDRGVDGVLRVLPRGGLYRDAHAGRPLTDPIVLDAFTHLLGLWGIERLPEGDVIFPLRLGKVEIFGDDPPEGADCRCVVRVKEIVRHRVTVDAEILRPDGRVWMRLTDWEDWRFYWPLRYRDVFRQPDKVFLGEPLAGVEPSRAVAVWLEPPLDMARPVWRDVLEATQLSVVERSGCLKPEGHDGRRTLRLWGRIAAKEAVRRLWMSEGISEIYPADLSIEPDFRGKPVLQKPATCSSFIPAISIAHVEGVAVAIAARQPESRVGIDVEPVVDRPESFEKMAFSAQERSRLDEVGLDQRAEWVARFWCAKEAAAKATGIGLNGLPTALAVTSVDWQDGTIEVEVGPELGERPITVQTQRRGDFVWGWTLIDSQEAVR